MESSNRNVWIIVAAIAALAGCCAVVALAAAAGAGWFLVWPVQRQVSTGLEGARIEQSFQVGGAPLLEIDNFAGSLTVRAGERDEIRVVATRRAPLGSGLDQIRVEMSERGGGLVIRTQKPRNLDNASVELEITAPSDTRLDAHTGAGSVEVGGLGGGVKVDTGAGSVRITDVAGPLDVESGAGSLVVQGLAGNARVRTGSGSVEIRDAVGEIDAHSGSGSVTVHGARGWVRLDTGTGSIDYQGAPEGDCRFETGSGSITLRLPRDLNMRVDLETGSGTVEVAYAVDGQVTRRRVTGVIGDGSRGSIRAHTGTGGIDLVTQ